tara:strand:- start:79 stop:387 length:309 start_codon:yes stop_codon:yes gene_type:complete
MNKHEMPEMYRVVFRAGNWLTKSKRYYMAFHSTEAFDDIYHSIMNGHVHAKHITVYKIEEYNRYASNWEDRFEPVINYIKEMEKDNIKLKSNKIKIYKRDGQ